MYTKKLIIPVLAGFLMATGAIAETADTEMVVITVAEEAAPSDESATWNRSEQRLNDKGAATAASTSGRRSSYAEHQQARASIIKPVATPTVAEAKNPATIRASVANLSSGTTSSAASAAGASAGSALISDEDLECSPGEMPSNGKCVVCEQKNNPGVLWAKPGENCTISECVNEDYELVSKKSGADAQCVKKCDIWGGTASKKWNRDLADWDICGSGSYLECADDYMKSYEQTSASGTAYAHCIPAGTLSGECKRDDSIKICNYNNIKAQQKCENGYWSLCTINRICETGFEETGRRDVYTVVGKADKRMSVFECQEKEAIKFKFN